jgi:hypothetical protein
LHFIEDIISKPLITSSVGIGHFVNRRSDPVYPITGQELRLSLPNPSLNYHRHHGLELLAPFREAIASHKSIVKIAKLGAGVGPHLAGPLNVASQREKASDPKLVLNA